jgi:hypothetical protein
MFASRACIAGPCAFDAKTTNATALLRLIANLPNRLIRRRRSGVGRLLRHARQAHVPVRRVEGSSARRTRVRSRKWRPQFRMSACRTSECRLYPRKQTSPEALVMSAPCQYATLPRLLNHLVGTRLQRQWHGEVEHLRGLRLITSSNLVGCCTGRSAGFSPRSTRSTYVAACRNR